jgi:beta-galactosidase
MTIRPATAPSPGAGLTRLSQLLYGGDYNPEQWTPDFWREDVRLMKQAGVNLVSVGIFAWAELERAEGDFRFGWLDEVLDLLHRHGIAVNLATPTASPPPWLVRQHPDMLPITAEGVTLWHGSRRHVCPHSRAYRSAAARIVRALAERYGQHPAVVMWHVDNEYAGHVNECFCEQAAAEFRRWLEQRYRSVEGVNQAWGTAFWGQRYGDLAEIEPPRAAPTFHNPSQVLDWRRFSSDAWLHCFLEQRAIVRELSPERPVTTNFMRFHQPLDYWKWAREEDIVSDDLYPDPADPDWMVESAMAADLMRSLAGGKPWLRMEQSTSLVNWRAHNVTKRPGLMRLGSYQALSRGADGIMFFQWRASRAGAERHHSAMVPHVGTDSRVWREVVGLGGELARCGELVGSRVAAQVAILFDWENWWALSSNGLPSDEVKQLGQLRSIYAALFERNITTDFAHPEADLSGYRLVIAPNLYLLTEGATANLRSYVAVGGNLLLSFFSSIVDSQDHVRVGRQPAGLEDVFGVTIAEFAPQPEGLLRPVVTLDGERFLTSFWCDAIELAGATPLARYDDGEFPAGPAMTESSFGKGRAFYMGTLPDQRGLGWLLERASGLAGVDQQAAPAGVELIERRTAGKRWLFALNYSDQPVTLPLAHAGVELLSGAQLSRSLTLRPFDLAIVRSPA